MWKFTSTLSIRIRGLDVVATEKNFNRKSRYWSLPFIIVYETSCLELWSEVTVMKVKGKVFPFHAMVAYGEVEIYLHSFLTLALDGDK